MTLRQQSIINVLLALVTVIMPDSSNTIEVKGHLEGEIGW